MKIIIHKNTQIIKNSQFIVSQKIATLIAGYEKKRIENICRITII